MLPLDFIEYLYLYLYTKEEYDCLGLYLFRMVIAHFSLLNCHKIIVTSLKFDITLKKKKEAINKLFIFLKTNISDTDQKNVCGIYEYIVTAEIFIQD